MPPTSPAKRKAVLFTVLGAFAVALCRIAGGAPVIAADLSESRRALALSLGAHHAFDPADRDCVQKIREASRGGVSAVVEVTGVSAALKQALAFTAKFGRVALLGSTRVAENDIDFYQDVHRPGIELIGAHTDARARHESRRGGDEDLIVLGTHILDLQAFFFGAPLLVSADVLVGGRSATFARDSSRK